jgi:hypothetical protein
MQMHFYVMPSSDMKEIKKDAFRDMGEKLQLWRHKLKENSTFKWAIHLI